MLDVDDALTEEVVHKRENRAPDETVEEGPGPPMRLPANVRL
jgi:hypothetical protein